MQEDVGKTIAKKKKCKKAECWSEEDLQTAGQEEKREAEEKGMIYPDECRVPENSKERKRRPSYENNANKQRKTIEWERLRISSRKPEILSERLMQGWAK